MLSSTATEPVPAIAADAQPETNAKSKFAPFTPLYAATIFLSAFLLFQVQLIIGKYILPWFGGSPSVWNTCLLVFQILLLLGYFYAHTVSTRLAAKSQVRLHIALLLVSLAVLGVMAAWWPSPITPGAAWKPVSSDSPEWRVICVLAVSVGFPFLILSTTSPLLQVWLSRARPGSPYRFYALSNAGSLLGLLSYPFLEERFFFLRTQAWIWSSTYALFLLAYGASAWLLQKYSSRVEGAHVRASNAAEKPGKGLQLMWLGLAACASAMLLATTNLICQEIAVIPLLWVLPLCVYLVTFIICFGHERWYRRGIFHPLYALAFLGALAVLAAEPAPHILLEITVFCVALFAVCMVCHGELVRSKPVREYLSLFYLRIAAGGAIGSVLVVLIAPRVFQRFWEFQLSLLICGILLLAVVFLDKDSWFYGHAALRVLLYAVVVAFLFEGWSYGKALIRLDAGGHVAFRARNFFGVKIGIEDRFGRWLIHGRTRHGVQMRDSSIHDEPTLYYKRLSGVGLLLDNYPRPVDPGGKARALRVGIVGLGAGTIAAYGHPGDYFRFYEIDPQVVALSLGHEPYFSFLEDCRATIDIVMGDARLSLEQEEAEGRLQKFDVIVLDAFNSDSIPVHLLTKEAMGLYIRHLSGPDSVIAFHLSNRSLDLRPVVAGLSRDYGMTPDEVDQPGFSVWALASLNGNMMNLPELKERSKPVTIRRAVPLWTDEYSNLFNVLGSVQE